VPRLSARHRVVTLDLAGHGESGRERDQWTMAAFGHDMEAVVDAVGAKQVVLVGHSMGGPVVLEATRRMPERVKGIVPIDTLLDVEERTSPDEVEAFAKQLEADYQTTVTRMAIEYLFAPATTNRDANRRHMPGYEASIITGTGHYPMLEDPARFDPALDAALRRVLAAKSGERAP